MLWRHRVQPNGLLEMIDRDAGVADISTNPTGRTKSRAGSVSAMRAGTRDGQFETIFDGGKIVPA